MFSEFEAIFKGAWAKQYRATSTEMLTRLMDLEIHEWSLGLQDLEQKFIEHGLAKCRRGSKWPPNLPEFRAMCLPAPEDFGIPEINAAFREAVQYASGALQRDKISHPVVYHVSLDVGLWDLTRAPEGILKNSFKKYYDKRVNAVISGVKLEIPKQKMLGRKQKRFSEAENSLARSCAMEKIMHALGGCHA